MNFKTIALLTVIALVAAGGYHQQRQEDRSAAASAQASGIEIYSASYCTTCAAAKAYMKRQGIGYTEYDVEKDIERRKEFYARGGKGIPLIFVRGESMEGFEPERFEALRRSAGL